MRTRLLWISDSPTLPSGYGRVTHEVLSRLRARGHAVCCLGIVYDGWPYDRGSFCLIKNCTPTCDSKRPTFEH